MPKVVLLPIAPKEAETVLNEKATVLVKKHFPKNYTGWVYLYCTKKKPYLYDFRKLCAEFRTEKVRQKYFDNLILNGKVVAAIWCGKVGHFEFGGYGPINPDIGYFFDNGSKLEKDFMTEKCSLSIDESCDRFGCGEGYAIHITKLFKFPYPCSIYEMHRVGFCEAKKSMPFIADKYEIIDWDKLMEYEDFLFEWHVYLTNNKWQYVDATEEELSQYDRG